MKQTTLKFDKKSPEPVTIQRLQEALDLINAGEKATYALRSKQLSSNWSIFFEKTLIIRRISGHKVEVLKPVIERKDFYKLLDLRSKYEKKIRDKRKIMSFYEQKKGSPFIGRVPLPSEIKIPQEIQSVRVRGGRVKKSVALPWWKRILLYLANR